MLIALNRINDPRSVARLQEWLIALGMSLAVDGQFGPRSEGALKYWQGGEGLKPDGIFGPASFTLMRDKIRDLHAGGKFKQGNTLLPADFAPGSNGYNFTRLRNDVAPAYRRLYDEAKSLGIRVTSAGGVRALSASVGPGRSTTSLHYAGLAFDMALDSGGVNPAGDAFVLERLANRRWRVWARVINPAAPNAPKHSVTIENPVTYAERHGTELPVTGTFINFTELANKHGFCDIPAHANWDKGTQDERTGVWTYEKAMTTLEWWHFQYEPALMHGFSTFGGEVLGLYTQAAINRYPAVAARAPRIWGLNWLG